ncbi:MAG: ABC transporter permease, partial [Traorella sp.]
ALLMRPKAPSNGKRILLERVHFIWDRLTFTYKVTCRNLFRYKKRFFMTVIGISGCTALLVAGYGIQDSINGIVSIQYDEIYQYDANILLDDDLNVVEKDELVNNLKNNEHIQDYIMVAHESSSVEIKGKDQSVDMMIVDDEEKFAEFYVLRNRNTHEVVEIPENGVVISEKMASDLGIGRGDKIEVEANDRIVNFVVEGVYENYIGHSMVMNTNTYKEAFGLTSKPNQLMIREVNGSDEVDSILGSYLTDLKGIESITFFRGSSKTFMDMISSLSIVVIVLVVSSGLLAFVVLYNLTNVNVSERIREIATLKVLGFYDKEVSSYVFRENIILSMIGSICGLGLGTILHRMIMSLAEMDNVMFGRIIDVKSYALGFIITMFFSWIVAKFMHYRLKKIPMVESLKSVE